MIYPAHSPDSPTLTALRSGTLEFVCQACRDVLIIRFQAHQSMLLIRERLLSAGWLEGSDGFYCPNHCYAQ